MNGSFLATILNGTIGAYAPAVTAVFGSDGIRMKKSAHLSTGVSIPVFPDDSNENEEGRQFTVQFGGERVVEVQVLQTRPILSEGGINGSTTLISALSEGNSVATLANGNVSRVSLASALGAESIEFSQASEETTTLVDLRNLCTDIERETAKEFGLSNRAKYKLMALVMREYHSPSEFLSPKNRGTSVCVPKRYRAIFKEYYL